ncbi:RNA helicase [PVC group bacterium (ex Bugula neritina AB1)]|nr:RNA helicase [PVC group bacterium (ex Bugula neritina AB1)]
MSKAVSFENCGLKKSTLDALEKKGFEEPTPVQAEVIPVILRSESDLFVQAQTGTGKTAAFALPLIDMIDVENNSVQAIVLTPTRELALQVSEDFHSLKGSEKIKTLPIYGGQSMEQQLRRLKKGVHIVIGTPGRVLAHINQRTLKLSSINYFVLDEADEMLSMGFIEDIEKILSFTPKSKRTFLFSATMPKSIEGLVKKHLVDYKRIVIEKKPLENSLTEQIYFEVRESDKLEAFCRILDIESFFYGMVFCRTKKNVDDLYSRLMGRGYDVGAIHGDMSQGQREKVFQLFRKKDITILIATDVAARGIDIGHLTHVINYSLPQDPESYVHRVGRTGRAGRSGTAITFITPTEYKKLMFIQRVSKMDIKKSKIPQIKQVLMAKKSRFEKEIDEHLIKFFKNSDEVSNIKRDSYEQWSKELLKDKSPENVLMGLLSYIFDEDLDPSSYRDLQKMPGNDGSLEKKGKARLFIALGKKDGLTPDKLIKKITDKVNVPVRQMRDIQILDAFSFVNVPFELAEEIVTSFKSKGKLPLITHAKGKSRGKSSFSGQAKGKKKGRPFKNKKH